MSIDSIKAQLQRIERQKRVLERQIAALQQEKIMALPAQVGLSSIDGLMIALIPFASSSMRAKLEAIGVDQMSVEDSSEMERHSAKTRFSPELKERIKAELEQGGKSVTRLSREYGPSQATIMSWKREWGMTRPRPRQQHNGSGH